VVKVALGCDAMFMGVGTFSMVLIDKRGATGILCNHAGAIAGLLLRVVVLE
jgi:hypothetical protein